MALAKLYNLARMTTATTGTGTITLGSAVSGFLTFAQAGIADGETVTYAIKDGTSSEIGRGVYTSSGTTLTRSVLRSTNSNSAISLSGSAQVLITSAAEDIKKVKFAASPPSSPDEGDMWCDTRTMETYIRWNDGATTAWVSMRANDRKSTSATSTSAPLLRQTGSQYMDGSTWTGSSNCKAGDLIILFLFRDGSTTAPSLPSGFTNIRADTGANSCSVRICWRVAAADDETFGTSTNATDKHALFFRGFAPGNSGLDAIGGSAQATGSSTTVTIPSITLSNGAIFRSYLAAFWGSRATDCDVGGAFGDFTPVQVGDDGSVDSSTSLFNPSYVTSWAGTTTTINGTSTGWVGATLEIISDVAVGHALPTGPELHEHWAGCTWDGEKWTAGDATPVRAWAAGEYDAGNGTVSLWNSGGIMGFTWEQNSAGIFFFPDQIAPNDSYATSVSGGAFWNATDTEADSIYMVYIDRCFFILNVDSISAGTPYSWNYFSVMAAWGEEHGQPWNISHD